MNIYLNGTPTEVSADQPLNALLQQLELGAQRFAVEVNGDIVPRSQFGHYRLHAEDKVEIVQAIGGG